MVVYCWPVVAVAKRENRRKSDPHSRICIQENALLLREEKASVFPNKLDLKGGPVLIIEVKDFWAIYDLGLSSSKSSIWRHKFQIVESFRIAHNAWGVKDSRHKLNKFKPFFFIARKSGECHIESSNSITRSSHLGAMAKGILCDIFLCLYMVPVELLQSKKSESSLSINH